MRRKQTRKSKKARRKGRGMRHNPKMFGAMTIARFSADIFVKTMYRVIRSKKMQ